MPKPLPRFDYAAAGGVVVDADRQHVLVLVRTRRLGPDGRTEVRLPKGHLKPGESRRQAALREVHEEAGLPALEILADLGQQTVEFDWQGYHHVRDERYFLMTPTPDTWLERPEEQFERLWLPWDEALDRLTFQAEREWVRRARSVASSV